MKKIRVVSMSFFVVLVMALGSSAGVPVAAQNQVQTPIAAVTITASEVVWQPLIKHAGALLTISGPGDFYLRQERQVGDPLVFRVKDSAGNLAPDGVYHYELRLLPSSGTVNYKELVQSGSFSILAAGFVLPIAPDSTDADPNRLRPLDVVHADDVIVTGSLCTGFDCVNNESFGFDTIRLKENNTRLHFDDTSTTAGFPANDWTLIANDSASGGASYFAVEDRTAARQILVLRAGAPANALYMDSSGRIGLRTSTPAENLHIWDSDTPAIRLDQSGSGWASQMWDVGGNEAYFFIRDVTHGSAFPFRIQPGAPSGSLSVKNDGRIGLGTWYPEAALEVERTGTDANLVLDRTDGVKVTLAAGSSGATLGTVTGHSLQVRVGNNPHTTFETNGNVTIEGGVLHENSNMYAKENFVAVDPQKVLAQLSQVPISTWNFKAGESDMRHMGPMAQDFYKAFGLGMDDQHIAPLDTNGVALASIQGLYEIVQEKDAQISALQTQNADLEARLSALESKIGSPSAPSPSTPSPSTQQSSFPTVIPWLLCGAVVIGWQLAAKRKEK